MIQHNQISTPGNNIIKAKAGIILGFVTGVVGFLLLFKVIVLDRTSPADELAPGIVVIASFVNGLFFAFLGKKIQNYLGKSSQNPA